MRLDLGRVGIEFEAEAGDNFGGEALPIDLWVGNDMRVVIADSTVQFSFDRNAFDRRDLAFEARVDIRHLLAESRGCRGLAMGAR